MIGPLGPILRESALMHRVAVALGDPSSFRFTSIMHDIPEEILGEVARDRLLEAAKLIADGWSTGGVAPRDMPQPAAPGAVNNIIMPPHESPGVIEGRYRFNVTSGKYNAFHRTFYFTIAEMTNGPMQVANLSTYVTGKPGHEFAVVTDATVRSLTSGGFFTKEGIVPVEVDKVRRQLKPRVLRTSALTELEAYDQVFDWLGMFVNIELAILLKDFVTRAAAAMEDYGPELMCPLEDLVRLFLLTRAIPLFNRPSSAAAPVLAAIGQAAISFLNEQTVVTNLLTMRGRIGAPSAGPQRANNAAGGGGGGGGGGGARAAAGGGGGPPHGPPPPGQQYHDPPPNKRRPLPFTDDIGRCPPIASRIALCYPTHSPFGRCPYAGNCTRQHNWANVTAAEQRLVEDWLKLWLLKQQWSHFVKWSDNGGAPAAWPQICG